LRTGKVENDERADWAEACARFPGNIAGNIAFVWHGERTLRPLHRARNPHTVTRQVSR
jgi:hypothetical protein